MLQIKKPIRARIEPHQGNIRICVTVEKKRYTIHFGLKDDPFNRQLLQAVVNQIKVDDQLGQFDRTLNKYKPKRSGRGGSLLLVSKLFKDFIEYKTPTLERNSLIRYQNTLSYIEKLLGGIEATNLTHELVQEFRDILLKEVSNNTTKDYLAILKSCFTWGVERKIVTANPFEKVLDGIKSNETKESEYFELDEVKLIFLKAPVLIPDYADYIKFLFLTGCRPSEAIALKWDDINFLKRKLTIDESFDGTTFKPTKTRKSRTIAMSDDVYQLLKLLKRDSILVFHQKNKPISYRIFCNSWKKFLDAIEVNYKSPYSCRHTFITHACRQIGEGGIADIAYVVGNSPEMILGHYFHKNEDKIIGFNF